MTLKIDMYCFSFGTQDAIFQIRNNTFCIRDSNIFQENVFMSLDPCQRSQVSEPFIDLCSAVFKNSVKLIGSTSLKHIHFPHLCLSNSFVSPTSTQRGQMRIRGSHKYLRWRDLQ